MSLLDTDALDVYLAPNELLKNYGIGIQTNLLSQVSGEKQTYSKGYLLTNRGTQAFIEVWYPGSKYYGTLWRYAGYPLDQNLVYIQYLDHPNSDWSARSEASFYGLNLEEFDMLYKAVKHEDLDTIYELQDSKPFIPEIITFH
jgi:hypothetical protein